MVEKKKDPSWDEIGKAIGAKIENEFKGKKCVPWEKPWKLYYKEHGGGFGRLVFILGVLFALNYMGFLANVPFWVLVVITIGFTLMKL